MVTQTLSPFGVTRRKLVKGPAYAIAPIRCKVIRRRIADYTIVHIPSHFLLTFLFQMYWHPANIIIYNGRQDLEKYRAAFGVLKSFSQINCLHSISLCLYFPMNPMNTFDLLGHHLVGKYWYGSKFESTSIRIPFAWQFFLVLFLKLSTPFAANIVKMKNFGAFRDGNFVKMTIFLFQWCRSDGLQREGKMIKHITCQANHCIIWIPPKCIFAPLSPLTVIIFYLTRCSRQ